ncbi:hypothetical protein RGU12_21345 [Fredinandcohnia sp. QZ13]|uniref:hypothetical protein n=1 Tax=Fredinandcohnia sp. QZ13 TaxID=3073144 RepID=UPI00285340F2|nr:hypothetical protein [Fredinandcohnia sp. QZ13]MDR4890046.1 hypothetical protein [Fredinandcohnia sp. QZ13]
MFTIIQRGVSSLISSITEIQNGAMLSIMEIAYGEKQSITVTANGVSTWMKGTRRYEKQ